MKGSSEMKFLEIVNCFINGASHEFGETYGCQMLDEDLSMAFDAAERYAQDYPDCTIGEAHAAGRRYIAS